MSAYRDLDEARAERFAVEHEPVDREWAEDGPRVTAEERALSDAFWAGDAA